MTKNKEKLKFCAAFHHGFYYYGEVIAVYTLEHCVRDGKFSTFCIFNNHATSRVIINHREVLEYFISRTSVQELG